MTQAECFKLKFKNGQQINQPIDVVSSFSVWYRVTWHDSVLCSWKHFFKTQRGGGNNVQWLCPSASLQHVIRITVFIFDFKGNAASWKCWHKSLHAWSLERCFTTLIKSAMQHISTFRGPAEEDGLESSIMRGKRHRVTTADRKHMKRKLHQLQQVGSGIRIKTVAKVYKKKLVHAYSS